LHCWHFGTKPFTKHHKNMNRKVIIIKGYSEDLSELHADNYYVNSYYTYFKSIAGGAYESDEIVQLLEPKSVDLDLLISKLGIEYCVIIFIGHGATQDNYQLFKLNKTEIIQPGQLNFQADKTLVILESCRSEVDNVLAVDLSDKLPKFKYGGTVRSPIDRVKAKDLYFQNIRTCNNGIVLCFACSINEEAFNYYFSYGLIQKSHDYHLDSSFHLQVHSIQTIMAVLIKQLPNFVHTKIGKIQTPKINGKFDYPFAISKF
jgi:hypothetical protein